MNIILFVDEFIMKKIKDIILILLFFNIPLLYSQEKMRLAIMNLQPKAVPNTTAEIVSDLTKIIKIF